VEKSGLVERHCPILTEATRWIGHVTIRNRGTVGGSIAHNDPSAEYPLVAILLGAEVGILASERSRRVAAADFLVTYLTTTLEANELVTEVRFPKVRPGTGWAFHEFARRHGDFAIAAAGVTLTMDGDLVNDVRIAVGGASPVAFRATDAEAVLRGQRWSEELVESAAAGVAGMAHPDSDVHASAEYRVHLATVLVRRALNDARQRTR
jgi:CO/xanthine dehydrogenase FAD-binding subunit